MSKKRISKKVFIIVGIVAVLILTGGYLWQHYKYRIVNKSLDNVLANNSDSLYYLSYDYLQFDEVAGDAHLKNVRIVPDTARVRMLSLDELPSVLLDIKIHSITIKGVQTIKALKGKNISGDTIIINRPEITMYVLKPLKKSTKIEVEAKTVYEEILGKLNSIKVGFVLIDSIQVRAVDFRTGKKNFDFLNGDIQLTDVLIDSAHNEDSSRILFSKSAAFTVDSFYSYNNNRPELIVKKVAFSGALRTIVFEKILLNRFNDATGDGKIMLDASTLKFAGLNTDEIVKNKNIIVDSVQCSEIRAYEPPRENLKDIGSKTDNPNPDEDTTSGFRNAYSISLKYLAFDNVKFIPLEQKKFDMGKVKVQLHDVYADRFAEMEKNPLNFIQEVNLDIGYLKLSSKDRQYNYGLLNMNINSLNKQLYIGEVYSKPVLSETAFANRYKYQKDRFIASMKGVTLDGIEMENLFNNKLIASKLSVRSTSLKIYRDLNKPLEQKSKVGNYPSQMLEQLDFPVAIKRASLPSVYVEYREKQEKTGKVGTVTFNQTSLNISNITNIKEEIAKNNLFNISFNSKALNAIPLKGNFKFYLGSKNGNFLVNGSTGEFDAAVLDKVSVPMALVHIKSGKINSIDFNFKGDNVKASGPMTMKYEDLKIDVMKKEEDSKDLKKRGFLSFLANIVVINDNPKNERLRKVEPEYERNIYKSFFNLVWKTLFTGIKETVGAP